MFSDKSRYAKVATVDAPARAARGALALKLRRLQHTPGEPHAVKDNDRLDLLAHERYGDGTRFWHVADANSALEAGELTAVTGESLNLPAP